MIGLVDPQLATWLPVHRNSIDYHTTLPHHPPGRVPPAPPGPDLNFHPVIC